MNRKHDLSHKYDLTFERYDEMFEAQEGKCMICSVDLVPHSKQSAVDHNHTTGKVRALLCSMCNRGLGHFKDNPDLLMRASNYLKQHAQNNESTTNDDDK